MAYNKTEKSDRPDAPMKRGPFVEEKRSVYSVQRRMQ